MQNYYLNTITYKQLMGRVVSTHDNSNKRIWGVVIGVELDRDVLSVEWESSIGATSRTHYHSIGDAIKELRFY